MDCTVISFPPSFSSYHFNIVTQIDSINVLDETYPPRNSSWCECNRLLTSSTPLGLDTFPHQWNIATPQITHQQVHTILHDRLLRQLLDDHALRPTYTIRVARWIGRNWILWGLWSILARIGDQYPYVRANGTFMSFCHQVSPKFRKILLIVPKSRFSIATLK